MWLEWKMLQSKLESSCRSLGCQNTGNLRQPEETVIVDDLDVSWDQFDDTGHDICDHGLCHFVFHFPWCSASFHHYSADCNQIHNTKIGQVHATDYYRMSSDWMSLDWMSLDLMMSASLLSDWTACAIRIKWGIVNKVQKVRYTWFDHISILTCSAYQSPPVMRKILR